nr:hypothetical protein [Mixta theicola]
MVILFLAKQGAGAAVFSHLTALLLFAPVRLPLFQKGNISLLRLSCCVLCPLCGDYPLAQGYALMDFSYVN